MTYFFGGSFRGLKILSSALIINYIKNKFKRLIVGGGEKSKASLMSVLFGELFIKGWLLMIFFENT